jgi:hypothetical protein
MVFLPFETIRRCSVQSRLIDSIVYVVRRVVIHAGHRVRARYLQEICLRFDNNKCPSYM